MKPILVVIVYLCNDRLSNQLFAEFANNLTFHIKGWQEKLPEVTIIDMIMPVQRDSSVSVKLLNGEKLATRDVVILKHLQKHLTEAANYTPINDAKTFYE